MSRYRIVHFVMVGFLGGLAQISTAKDLNLESLREIQSNLKSSDSLSMKFEQETYSSMRDKTVRRSGRALFLKPNLFKWMLETPRKEYKIFDGSDFYDYLPEENAAKKYSATGPSSHELRRVVDLVLNFDALLKSYDLIKATETDGIVTMEMKPRTGSDIKSVEIRLSLKESAVIYLRLNLANKNALTHHFSDPVRSPLQKTEFSLPQTVKVTVSN